VAASLLDPASIAGFAVVAFGHPDGFDGVCGRGASGDRYKVALGSVGGAESFGDAGKADGVSGLRELLPELFGERGEVVEGLGPVPVKGLGKLADAVGGRGKLL
jgi:hypothetical protein